MPELPNMTSKINMENEVKTIKTFSKNTSNDVITAEINFRTIKNNAKIAENNDRAETDNKKGWMRILKTCHKDRNDIKTFENNTKISKMIVITTENGFKMN